MLEENPRPEDESVALDDYIPVLEAWHEASVRIKELNAEIEKYKTLLTKVMGDAVIGTVDGVKVLDFKPIESFNGKEFEKRFPETYRFYVREVTTKTLDKSAIQATRPDLWEQFQSRPMKSTYVPRDKAQ